MGAGAAHGGRSGAASWSARRGPLGSTASFPYGPRSSGPAVRCVRVQIRPPGTSPRPLHRAHAQPRWHAGPPCGDIAKLGDPCICEQRIGVAMGRQRAHRRSRNKCPHDGNPAQQSPRYPKALCEACIDRATDLAGRPIRMGDADFDRGLLGLGFLAIHADDGTECEQVTADGLVLIDSVRYWACEGHFGGVVVQP